MDMPVGQCCVCEEQLDHSQAGFCDRCKNVFCWDTCGGWENSEHRCQGCSEEDREDE